MSPTPTIKAKLTLVPDSGVGGGAGAGGVFSASEERSFRLEQKKGFKGMALLGSSAGVLGGGLLAALFGAQILEPPSQQKGPGGKTASELAEEFWKSLFDGEDKTLAESAKELDDTVGFIDKSIDFAGDVIKDTLSSLPGPFSAFGDLLLKLGRPFAEAIDNVSNFSNALSVAASRVESGPFMAGGGKGQPLSSSEISSIQREFRPRTGEETAGDVLRRIRRDTAQTGQSNTG